MSFQPFQQTYTMKQENTNKNTEEKKIKRKQKRAEANG